MAGSCFPSSLPSAPGNPEPNPSAVKGQQEKKKKKKLHEKQQQKKKPPHPPLPPGLSFGRCSAGHCGLTAELWFPTSKKKPNFCIFSSLGKRGLMEPPGCVCSEPPGPGRASRQDPLPNSSTRHSHLAQPIPLLRALQGPGSLLPLSQNIPELPTPRARPPSRRDSILDRARRGGRCHHRPHLLPVPVSLPPPEKPWERQCVTSVSPPPLPPGPGGCQPHASESQRCLGGAGAIPGAPQGSPALS